MVTEGETNSHTQLKKSEHKNRASKIKTVDRSSCVSLKGTACLFQVIGKTSVNAGKVHVMNKEGDGGGFKVL